MLAHCDTCAAIVGAEFKFQYFGGDEDETRLRYQLFECPRCNGPFLFVAENRFDVGSDWEGFTWYNQRRIYPAQDLVKALAFPSPVQKAFAEASRCRSAQAHTATAMLCRKTIEAVCVSHGVKGSNLAESLRMLRANGVIEHRLYDWADHLRIVGNEAAHNVEDDTNPQDAADIFDFTSALLEYVFTFRDRFEAFKARRKTATLNPSPAASDDPLAVDDDDLPF